MRATILAVDDDEDVRNLLELTLKKEHAVRLAGSAEAALKAAFEEPRPDLILLDVEMPDASGYDVCKTLKASPVVADIPVVFLTSRAETRDVVQGFQLGALDYLVKPISPPVLAARVRTHLELIERRNRQEELLRERSIQLEHTRLELVRRLGRAMEYHETSAIGNRVVRLGHYARALAQAAGARPILCDMLLKAAPLHDIGKVGVPAAVLRKSGALSVPEREQMQRHPEIGAEIIGTHDDPLLKLARTLAFTHHERWDGTGYPTGARGNDIPWAGRVMAIVDAFESMTVTQFHREPRPPDLAADEIVKGGGKQFDPAMVIAFRKALPEFKRIHSTYADQLGDMLDLDFSSAPAPATPAPVEERQKIDADAAAAMRQGDEARAKALSAAQARLRIEHDLAASAQKDIVTQHNARKEAELLAAREAELLAAAKKRTTDETTATRFARERTEAEQKAAGLARQRAEAEEAAARAAVERAEAEALAIDAAKARGEAEKAAEAAAVLRAQAERALEELLAEKAKLEGELGSIAAAQEAEAQARRDAEAEVAETQAAVEELRGKLVSERARPAPASFTSGLAELLEEKSRLRQKLDALAAERVAAEEAAAAAGADKASAAEGELEELRGQLNRERVLVEAARQQAAEAASDEAIVEKRRLEDELARLAAERATLEEAAARVAAERGEAAASLDALREKLGLEEELLAQAVQGAPEAADTVHAERARLEEEIANVIAEREALEAKAEQERAAAALALGDLRQGLSRELEALAAASAEREAAETAAARAQQDLAALRAELASLNQAVAREAEALASARRQRDDSEAAAVEAAAEKATLEDKRPLIIGPPPRPVPQRRTALAAFLLGALIATAGWYALRPEEPPPVQAKAPPPPAPVASKAAEETAPGEPLKLRFDTTFERIPAK